MDGRGQKGHIESRFISERSREKYEILATQTEKRDKLKPQYNQLYEETNTSLARMGVLLEISQPSPKPNTSA